MALNIEGATYGYDKDGLSALKENIRIKCIEQTKDTLSKGHTDLKDKIDEAWVGSSANKFKIKLAGDIHDTKNAIDNVGATISKILTDALKGMADVDESITF